MSTRSGSLKKRFPWLRQVLQIEQVLVFVGVVVYAVLVSVGQKVSLLVILLSCLTVGNCVVPLAFLIRRAYVPRHYPWNWIIFIPVQFAFGIVCAVGSVLLLQLTRIDPEPFWVVYGRMGNLTIIVVIVVAGTMYGIEQVQQKLRERNQQLEQTVEKGTIALQQQEEELKRAREIQQMLLPNKLPQLAGAQIAGAWQPAREVGGDYFDVIPFDEKRVGICMGDVAGKGITAALLMANLQASVRAFATADATPREVCTKLNKFLCANIVSGKFVTFFYAVFDAESRTLVYENAGHNPGLLVRANGLVESLRGDGAVLGVIADWGYQDFTVQLQPGDKLLLSTDGITEAENARLEEFGDQRLLEAAKGDAANALDTQRAIMQRVTAFCGGNFRDDATLLVLKVV